MTRSALIDTFVSSRRDLLRLLVARLGQDNGAEDVLQDVYMKLERLDPAFMPDKPLPFLFRIALNTAFDRQRQHRRDQVRSQAWLATTTTAGDTATDPVDEAPDAERALIARDRLGRLLQAVEALTPQTQRVFRRHKLDGLTHGEVAAELGISRSAVEKHMIAALRHLGNALSDENDPP